MLEFSLVQNIKLGGDLSCLNGPFSTNYLKVFPGDIERSRAYTIVILLLVGILIFKDFSS